MGSIGTPSRVDFPLFRRLHLSTENHQMLMIWRATWNFNWLYDEKYNNLNSSVWCLFVASIDVTTTSARKHTLEMYRGLKESSTVEIVIRRWCDPLWIVTSVL